MKSRAGQVVCVIALTVLVASCDNAPAKKAAAPGAVPTVVAKVKSCGPGDRPEPALQGQIPAADRSNGFHGYNCNLTLVGKDAGLSGVGLTTLKDDHGHYCAYYSTGIGPNGGTKVVDITDPVNPVVTATLTTPAMAQPRETLRINAKRQLLAAFKDSQPDFDIYDLSKDCRTPKLLASLPLAPGVNGGVAEGFPIIGHDANFSLDGMTYYDGEGQSKRYSAIDVSDPTKPRIISQVDIGSGPLAQPGLNGFTHGVSLSEDGNRAYVVHIGYPTGAQLADPNFKPADGMYVLDTSEVQARKPNPQMKIISGVAFPNGSGAQHTLAIKIGGKPYVVFVDEIGSGGIPGMTAGAITPQQACDLKRTPFAQPRLIDISDETKPRLVAELGLETHDIANCRKVIPDIVGEGVITYGSHICSVDNRENATALACTYMQSGIRVFDIRDPSKPKEIAYYNPAPTGQLEIVKVPDVKTPSVLTGEKPSSANLCGAAAGFDFERKLLTSACMRSGLVVLKFTDGVWPFPESTPSARTVSYN